MRRQIVLDPRICKNCYEEFVPKKKWQKFCTPGCRTQYWDYNNPRIRSVSPAETGKP